MKTAHVWAVFAAMAGSSDDEANPGGDAADTRDAADTADSAGDSSGDSAGDSAEDSAGDAGDTGGGDGITLVDDPILERESLGTATCTIERDITRVDDSFETQFQIESMVTVADDAFVTRAGVDLSLAKLELDGSFSDVAVLDPDQYSSGGAAAATDGSSIAVVWQKVDQATNEGGLRFAKFAAADLGVEVAEKDLKLGHGGYTQTQSVLVADGAGGWALLYNEGKDLTFVKIAADGTPGSKVSVVKGQETWLGFAQNMIKTAAGQYAASWSQGPYDASEVVFARLDAAGTKASGPHRISRAAGGGYSSGASFRATGSGLIEVGDKLWATFSESYSTGEPFVDQQTSVVARVAVIDGDGNGELHVLQAPVEDKTVELPTLRPYRDSVAALWSYGTLIYICGGCIADYDIHLALIDPATMRPTADSLVAVSTDNGYRNPRGVFVGDQLVVTTAIDFHALWFPATAVFACSAE